MRRSRAGFTLIELLIVVVIIGILASIAIPRFSSAKEKAYVSAIKSDLRNLANAQEVYFSDAYRYAPAVTTTGLEFSQSTGVTVTIGTVTQTQWTAAATHAATSKTCFLSVGAGANGIVTCP